MGFFATITFDIKPAKHSQVTRKLGKIDFNKFLLKKKSEKVNLPRNIYVAEFDNDDFDEPSKIKDFVREEIKRIFEECNVNGKYVILVGKKVAWATGKV